MFTSDLNEQIQYCISTDCTSCDYEIQKCKYLTHKIDELNSNEKYGNMCSKAKKKLWHFRGGMSRGKLQKGRRKKNH